MASIYVIPEFSTASKIYVAVPFGQQQDPGDVSFSGTSLVGEASLGLAQSGKQRCVIKTNSLDDLASLLGVVRWGFRGVATDGSVLFVEKGWDFLKSGGKVVDYPDMPAGSQMDVRVRWYRPGVTWQCLYS